MASKKGRMTAVQRRAQLIEVGRRVFAEHGYEGGSVEEIARVAKVSKPIVYEHFGGKEGLYAVVVDREMEALVQRIAAQIGEGSPRHRFEAAVLAFLTYVKEEPEGFAVLTRDAPQMANRGMQNVISELVARIGDIFEQQLAAVGLETKFAGLYAHALTGMVTLVGQWWIDDRKEDVAVVARHTAAIGWMGLRHIPEAPKFEGDD